jgi:hypothetical protein
MSIVRNRLIHLYIDSSLEVYSPDGECNYYRKPKSERFFIKHYNDKDYQWNLNFVEKAGMRMLYLSKSRDPLYRGFRPQSHLTHNPSHLIAADFKAIFIEFFNDSARTITGSNNIVFGDLPAIGGLAPLDMFLM